MSCVLAMPPHIVFDRPKFNTKHTHTPENIIMYIAVYYYFICYRSIEVRRKQNHLFDNDSPNYDDNLKKIPNLSKIKQ